jgi:Transglycosylase-like domain
LKARLIAVISVGIAAATPAVAVSADATETAPAVKTPAPAGTDVRQPVSPVQIQNPMRNTTQQKQRQRLVRKYVKRRKRANRLIVRLHDRRVSRAAEEAVQLRWSNRGLRRALHTLTRRIVRLRTALKDKRSGLTPAVRATLERIAYCESHGNPRAIGGGGAFRGKYQFTYGTWYAVGGRGDPAAAPEAEQDRRAASLLRRSGGSPWPVCG